MGREASVESGVLPVVICRPKNPTLARQLRRSTLGNGLEGVSYHRPVMDVSVARFNGLRRVRLLFRLCAI